MIDYQRIATEFAGLVGYRNENEITLNPALNQSDSGLFVNDLAGVDLISIDRASFLKSDLTPETSVSDYLSGIYDKELQKLMLYFSQKKDKILGIKSKIQDKNLCQNSAKRDKIEQEGRFVGWYFQFLNGKNLFADIQKASLQLDKPQTVRLFLYSSIQTDPIATFDLPVSSDFDKIMTDLSDFLIKYQNENGENIKYLLGYYEYQAGDPQTWQLDSDSQAYNIDYDEPNYSIFNNLQFAPCYIASDYLDANYKAPDFQRIAITNQSFGLDAKIKVDCDMTDIIIANKMLFAEALQYMLALRIISDCYYSKEFNSITESNRKSWQSLIIHFNNLLNGYEFVDGQGNSGRKAGLIEEIVTMLEGIDYQCFTRRRVMKL